MKALKIRAIYDAGDVFVDRYTILLEDGSCLGVSVDPEHPQGVSQFSDCLPGPHLGQHIVFADLPTKVQVHVRRRLTEK